MVDAEDLKSFGHCDRVGSSPTIPTILRQGYVWQAKFAKVLWQAKFAKRIRRFFFGCVAQLVRVFRSHRRGRRFESVHIHHRFYLMFLLNIMFDLKLLLVYNIT